MELDLDALRSLAAAQHLPVDEVADVVAAALTDAYQRSDGAIAGTRVVPHPPTGAFVLQHTDGTTTATPKEFGRTAAAAARQAIVQWMRDQERRRAVGPWASREGTVLLATVVRHVPARGKNGPETLLRVDGTDAVLPAGEAVAGEDLTPGRQLTVLLLNANVDDRDRIKLTVSRRQPALVTALLTKHVPELRQGTVTVSAIARDPGSRTKVAVTAAPGTDARAAIVGPGAERIRAVTAALSGEKIDVVTRPADLPGFVAAALTPAEVAAVDLTAPGRVTVTVRPDQMVLAAGRDKANVRLAQRLTGARIELRAA